MSGNIARVYPPGTEPAKLTSKLDVPRPAGQELATAANANLAVLDVHNLAR